MIRNTIAYLVLGEKAADYKQNQYIEIMLK